MQPKASTSGVFASGRTIALGDYEATFLPEYGMLGASLKFKGIELLRQIQDLDVAAVKGSTAGIPFMHPWANRIDGMKYTVAGKQVTLDARSSLLHFDGNGLPIHGVPWSKLPWQIVAATPSSIRASLEWSSSDLLAIFPFPHRVEMLTKLDCEGLQIEVTLLAGEVGPVPVSFGFHPYFGLSGAPRDSWRLTMPGMQRLSLDARCIPTGDRSQYPAFDHLLAGHSFDDGFAIEGEGESFQLEGGGLRLRVTFENGYPYAQIYAPTGKEFIAIEPMTAPIDALHNGDGLQIVRANESFRASFRVSASAI